MNRRSPLLALLLIAPATCLSSNADDFLEERRLRLEQMSAVEKDKLSSNYEKWLKLKEQSQLRDLERQLADDPKGEELRQVMLRYHEWLRALSAAERATLLSLPEEERILRIREILDKQEADRSLEEAKETLTPDDVQQVRDWLGELIAERKSKLLQHLSEEERERFSQFNDPRKIIFEWIIIQRNRPQRPMMLTQALDIEDADRQALVEKLSAGAQAFYQQEGTSEEKKQTTVQNWVFITFRRPSTQDLHEFLKRMPPDVRDRLENLPPEQMKAELGRRFYEYRRFHQDGKRPPFPGDRGSERSGDFRKGPPRSGFKSSPPDSPNK